MVFTPRDKGVTLWRQIGDLAASPLPCARSATSTETYRAPTDFLWTYFLRLLLGVVLALQEGVHVVLRLARLEGLAELANAVIDGSVH